ncbi:MAG TPA: universal stress protein [Verrucomicrobiae bacterium]|nr:universal stress protein [Verrucomicrobiae bacterium]
MKAKPSGKTGNVTIEMGSRDEALMEAASSPFRMRRILVPVDFSDCSQKALQYALPLARSQQAALTLAHVVHPVYTVGEYGALDTAQIEATMKAGAEKELAKLAASASGEGPPVNTVVRIGPPAREIIEVANDLAADLIVISTHGRTGLKHILLGSVAEQVVRHAPCPVLVVREREREIIVN